jgi:hypothetical protein
MVESSYLTDVFRLSPYPGVVVKADIPTFTVVAANAEFLKATGTTEPDLLHKSISTLLDRVAPQNPEATPGIVGSMIQAFKTGQVQKLPPIYMDTSKSNQDATNAKWWLPEIIPLQDVNKSIDYLFCTAKEIQSPIEPAPVQHNQAVSSSAASFTSVDVEKELYENNIILESIGDAFFRVDNNWVVTYWNNQAEKILGQARENIINRNLWDIYEEERDGVYHTN